MNSNEAFKERVQKALGASRFSTQKELVRAMDVREATVSGWFNGAWPREDQMRGLVAALDVSGHWLVTGEGPMRRGDDSDAYRLQIIGKVADGKISPQILQTAETVHRLESLEDLPAEMRDAIAKIRESESTAIAQP